MVLLHKDVLFRNPTCVEKILVLQNKVKMTQTVSKIDFKPIFLMEINWKFLSLKFKYLNNFVDEREKPQSVNVALFAIFMPGVNYKTFYGCN